MNWNNQITAKKEYHKSVHYSTLVSTITVDSCYDLRRVLTLRALSAACLASPSSNLPLLNRIAVGTAFVSSRKGADLFRRRERPPLPLPLGCPKDATFRSALCASAASTFARSETSPSALFSSFSFVIRRSTMRFANTLPTRACNAHTEGMKRTGEGGPHMLLLKACSTVLYIPALAVRQNWPIECAGWNLKAQQHVRKWDWQHCDWVLEAPGGLQC